MSTSKTQVKVACLNCRASKTRCDGQRPCATCLATQRDCHYRPSRRGGARRGERYEYAKKQRTHAASYPQTSPFSPLSTENTHSLGDGIVGLIYPFNDLQGVRGFDDSGLLSGMFQPNRTINADDSNPWSIRTYRCEGELINAYYIFIHPYLPLLPFSTSPRFSDRPFRVSLTNVQPDRSCLPFWPTSSFGLAIMAILVLIPLPDDPSPMREGSIVVRRAYASMYAQAALDAVDNYDLAANQDHDAASQESLNSHVPSILEPVMALLLLGVYEYCQNANRRQMRARIYQALTISMDLSLHNLDPESSNCSNAHRRVWWMTMYLVYQSAIFNHSSPIVLIHDPRITTPFPDICGNRELWPALMRAQDTLLKTGAIAKELTEDKITGPHELLRERVCELDSIVLGLAAELDQPREMTATDGDDASASQNLWLKARFLTHTARIKLHRFRAFGDYPVFLDKFCDLSSINSSHFSDFSFTLSPGKLADIDSIFPFTEQESTHICLKAALGLSRILRHFAWPNPFYSDAVAGGKPSEALRDSTGSCPPPATRLQYPRSLPYLACCGMQSCYVLMMLLRKVRSSLCSGDLSTCYYILGHPEPGTERQDAERLIEELRHGVKSVCLFMASNAVFEGVVGMAREVETIYSAHFHD